MFYICHSLPMKDIHPTLTRWLVSHQQANAAQMPSLTPSPFDIHHLLCGRTKPRTSMQR